MTRRRHAATAGVIAVIAAGGAGIHFGGFTDRPGPDGDAPQGESLPPATVTVQRGDLSESAEATGTLGFERQRKINAGGAGTVTWVAGGGSTVRREERLYEIDGQAVRLMYGTTPMYRTVKSGDKGQDVRQIEENLAALGYTGFTPDDEYTGLTAAAVKRWQKNHGLSATGTLGTDQVAFSAAALRVKSADTPVGGQTAPGTPVLTVTGSERVVTFGLDVTSSELAKKGTKVSVTLPDGTELKGAISSVGKTIAPGEDPQDTTPKITLTVAFDKPGEVGGIDQSPVTVNLVGRTAEDVLTVPVNALLAAPGGGFGLQVVKDGESRDIEVELGMFADGKVEVSGSGLREGMKVGVPKI